VYTFVGYCVMFHCTYMSCKVEIRCLLPFLVSVKKEIQLGKDTSDSGFISIKMMIYFWGQVWYLWLASRVCWRCLCKGPSPNSQYEFVFLRKETRWPISFFPVLCSFYCDLVKASRRKTFFFVVLGVDPKALLGQHSTTESKPSKR
jgi:hypothetical protein